VWLEAGLTDSLNDVLNLLFGRIVRHIDDHRLILFRVSLPPKNKNRDSESRLRLESFELSFIA
jgi:hypothetical protein